jgi:hypothetical protein
MTEQNLIPDDADDTEGHSRPHETALSTDAVEADDGDDTEGHIKA